MALAAELAGRRVGGGHRGECGRRLGGSDCRLAGIAPLGLQPKRRTALLLDTGLDVSGWPLVHRAQEGLYFKPEGGLLMVSPADTIPNEPCDAQPEEMDMAIAVDRFQATTTLEVKRLSRTWAGLRSFLPDEVPAVGLFGGSGEFFLACRSGWLRPADRPGTELARCSTAARRRSRAGSGTVAGTFRRAGVTSGSSSVQLGAGLRARAPRAVGQRPSTSFATMFFCTSLLPPAMELARRLKYRAKATEPGLDHAAGGLSPARSSNPRIPARVR